MTSPRLLYISKPSPFGASIFQVTMLSLPHHPRFGAAASKRIAGATIRQNVRFSWARVPAKSRPRSPNRCCTPRHAAPICGIWPPRASPFKALLAFGAVGQSEAALAWKSTNRRHFLSVESGDDSLGYDFEFPKDGLLRQIEVKASTGEPQFVDLADSEVNAARLAVKRRSRKKYTICLVTSALTEPQFATLGNPFLPSESSKFRVQEGGARVYFRLSKQDSESEENSSDSE